MTVVPTLSRCDLVRNFERSFADTAPPEEPAVFVVMGADDGTAGFLAERASKKKRCRRPYSSILQTNVLHFAAAVNLGVKHALATYPDAEAIVVANNDLILQPGWYQAATEALDGGVEITGAKLVYPYDAEMIAGKFQPGMIFDAPSEPRKIQHFGKWFTLDFFPFHVLRHEPETHEKTQLPMVCPDVTFALVCIRRDVWEALDGLDETFVNGFEDDDFCLRGREKGCEIGVHPGLRAIHLESQTTGADNSNKEAQWRHFSEKWIDDGRIQWPLGVFQGWYR